MKKKTIIRLSITLVVIVALGLWINSRWSAWFHNEEELPYAPLSEPGRVLLTFGDENELSRNISWQYDSIVVPSHVDLVDKILYRLRHREKPSVRAVEWLLTM